MDGMTVERKIAKTRVNKENEGNVYTFFCELSGAAFYRTAPIRAETQKKELEIAWNEAKQYVNVCHKCGCNVIDALYNVETLECVRCSPWQKPPHFCSDCGNSIEKTDLFCSKCGKKIPQEGVDEDAGG